MKRWLLIAGRVAVGIIFLYAGYAKLREPWLQFAISIETFKAVPETWLEPIARTLPAFEVVLGLGLLSGFMTRWFALVAAGMLTFFLALGISAHTRGLTVDCGCFGAGNSGAIDARWFAEHVAMMLLGVGVAAGAFLTNRR